MKDLDNFQGNPRVFSAAFGKDIVIKLIEKFNVEAYDKVQAEKFYGQIMADFDFFADHIYDWITQSPPMTDRQYEFIEELMKELKFTDKQIQEAKDNIRPYTTKQASDLIDKIMQDEALPPQYREDYRAKKLWLATADRTSREP